MIARDKTWVLQSVPTRLPPCPWAQLSEVVEKTLLFSGNFSTFSLSPPALVEQPGQLSGVHISSSAFLQETLFARISVLLIIIAHKELGSCNFTDLDWLILSFKMSFFFLAMLWLLPNYIKSMWSAVTLTAIFSHVFSQVLLEEISKNARECLHLKIRRGG